jgi:hypothetical protein
VGGARLPVLALLALIAACVTTPAGPRLTPMAAATGEVACALAQTACSVAGRDCSALGRLCEAGVSALRVAVDYSQPAPTLLYCVPHPDPDDESDCARLDGQGDEACLVCFDDPAEAAGALATEPECPPAGTRVDHPDREGVVLVYGEDCELTEVAP